MDRPAILEESWQREALQVWQAVEVVSIDGKFVSPAFLAGQGRGKLKIDPGVHRIVASVRFNKGSGVFDGKAVMEFELQSAATYRLAGEVIDAEVHIWAVDKATGQTVSEIARGPFLKAAKVVGVPIII